MTEEPTLLQTGPETFEVRIAGRAAFRAELAHHTRRGLSLHGVPPLTVATEIVRFLLERDAIPATDDGARDAPVVSLGAAAGQYPGFVDELRSRLT